MNGDVNAILPGPTANTAYIAGKFTSLANTAVNKVALININTGVVDSTSKAPAIGSGEVNDLFRVGNRLYLAGSFPKGRWGQPRRACQPERQRPALLTHS